MADKIRIMVNGLPGNMSKTICRHALMDGRFEMIPFSLTGPEIEEEETRIGENNWELVLPGQREERLKDIMNQYPEFISIDYTHPAAVNSNAEFYCRNQLPFVMGTTGGDREKLVQTVEQSENAAVIAPNMAKQIVGFQAMMEYASKNFPDLFKGFQLTIRESHQKGKADTSGTAKAVLKCFNQMGVSFHVDEIQKERDPEVQKNDWGVPEAYLGGHGWHTYTLLSGDETLKLEFTHNMNGRDAYALGTLDAVSFLWKQLETGVKGRVFTMIEVLKGV